MAHYRDITCDPISGTRVIDYTASAILDVLTASLGAPVNCHDIDRAIVSGGGQLNCKPHARKALANVGYVIDVEKRRQYTSWRLAGTPDEIEEHRGRVMQEVYSRTVSLGRMLSGQLAYNPADAVAIQSHRMAELLAITVGGDPAVGRTATQALADLDPLPIP